MKFICLGYIKEDLLGSLSESEAHAFIDRCLAYDDEMRAKGHTVGGAALQGPRTAVTLRYENGEIISTDGPFAETKEQLGGIMFLEADSLEQAVELMSKHPGVFEGGSFEVRPAADLEALIDESEKRRGVTPA